MLASEMSLQPIFNHIRTQSENIELKRYGRPKSIIKNKKKVVYFLMKFVAN